MLLTRCSAMQAGHRTRRWVFCGGAPSRSSSSRCWTFMPTRGHLNRLWRSIGKAYTCSRMIEITVDYLRAQLADPRSERPALTYLPGGRSGSLPTSGPTDLGTQGRRRIRQQDLCLGRRCFRCRAEEMAGAQRQEKAAAETTNSNLTRHFRAARVKSSNPKFA